MSEAVAMPAAPANPDRIPIKERMLVQSLIVRIMLGDKPARPSREEETAWNEKRVEWLLKYSNIISGIIDNPKHDGVRALIFAGNYQRAAEIILPLLPKG